MMQLMNIFVLTGWPQILFVPGTRLPLDKTQMIKLHVYYYYYIII